jgi:hypothetical protein
MMNTAGSWLWPASMDVNHQCQTAIFSCGRSSNKDSENVSFEIFQVGSLDCESSQKYISILQPHKFRPVCNLLFKWYHYNRTVLVTSYLHWVIWLRRSSVHYNSALYALALHQGHWQVTNWPPQIFHQVFWGMTTHCAYPEIWVLFMSISFCKDIFRLARTIQQFLPMRSWG